MPYTHLTPTERGQMQALQESGCSQAEIARCLGRHRSTIKRELERNGAASGGYRAAQAQRAYGVRRQACRRTRSLDHAPLRRYVFEKMTEGWSPEQIAGRLWREFPGQPRMRVSHETIYRTLYEVPAFGRPLIPCLRQRRPRRRKRGQRKPVRPFIPNRLGIEARPPEVDALARYGDWEGDLVLGAGQRGAVLTLVERKSLFLCARKLDSKSAAGAAGAAIDALMPLPAQARQTITFDNGSEFAHHEHITRKTRAIVYFAHPYAAYERGRNENTNGLLRQYLPKKTSFEHLQEQQLQRIAEELNNRPRKTLDYRTPAETLASALVALTP